MGVLQALEYINRRIDTLTGDMSDPNTYEDMKREPWKILETWIDDLKIIKRELTKWSENL